MSRSMRPEMTADWVCSGQMSGKGSLESNWSEPDHARARFTLSDHADGATVGAGGVDFEFRIGI